MAELARNGGIMVRTVTLAWEELLAVFRSISFAVNEAMLVNTPAAAALVVMARVALAPELRLPTFQVMMPLTLTAPPWEGTSETAFKPAGSVSVKITPVLVVGPLLAALTV